MQLLDDWKKIARKAWSFRLGILAALLSGVEVILPFFENKFPRGVFAGLAFAVTVSAAVARLVAQPRMADDE